jgi:hypothetical protein
MTLARCMPSLTKYLEPLVRLRYSQHPAQAE